MKFENRHRAFTLRHLNLSTRRLGRGSAALLLLLTSACGGGTNNNATETVSPAPTTASTPTTTSTPLATSSGPLKIGTLLPITGDLAQFGQPMQDSVNLLVKTVNGCGGALGKPVELVSGDDQTEPAAGAAAMTKLAEVDKVAGVVGAAASSVTSAAVDIAVRNKVAIISPASTSPVFTERAKKGDFNGYWARTAPPDSFQGEAIAQLAKEQGIKSIAVFAINNDYGKGLVDSFIPAFEAVGGTIVNKDKPVLYPPDASTFDTEVSAAFKGEPDAVLLVAYPESGSLILKAAYQQGVLGKKTKLLVTDGMRDPKIASLAGKSADDKFIAEGVIGTAPSAEGGPAIETFRTLYKQTYNRDPKVYDPNSWDAAALMILAAEAAKNSTGDGIKSQLANVANAPGEEVSDVCQALTLVREGKDINYQGASGTVDLNPQGDVTGSYDLWTIAPEGDVKVTGNISVSGS